MNMNELQSQINKVKSGMSLLTDELEKMKKDISEMNAKNSIELELQFARGRAAAFEDVVEKFILRCGP